MEEQTVQTIGIVLVVSVALFAAYKIFEGSSIFGALGAPGGTTLNLTSIPGVPEYPNGAGTLASATPGALSAVAASNFSEYSPAFGTGANPTSSDETDYDDLDFSTDDNDSYSGVV
jgi:hypothetical protein